jgi:hypothetical protein
LRDDVCGSNLLGLGLVYFRGNVGLHEIQSLMCLFVESLILRKECVFVVLRLYTLQDEVDSLVMLQFAVSSISDVFIGSTSGEIFGGPGVIC